MWRPPELDRGYRSMCREACHLDDDRRDHDRLTVGCAICPWIEPLGGIRDPWGASRRRRYVTGAVPPSTRLTDPTARVGPAASRVASASASASSDSSAITSVTIPASLASA